MVFLLLGWIKVRESNSAISMVRSVSAKPLALGQTRYNSIPRIESGCLRIQNWRLEVQDLFFDMDSCGPTISVLFHTDGMLSSMRIHVARYELPIFAPAYMMCLANISNPMSGSQEG